MIRIFKNKKFLVVFTAFVFVLLVAGCNNATTTTTNATTTTADTGSTVLNTDFTDNLQLTESYEGKDFVTDGIGQVTLNACVDGDTAHFMDNGHSIAVRFLGINTPESTALVQPWGKAASHFTCDKLTNATTIVLQRESEVFDSSGTRYMAWVWYDGRLLNLELVENAYTKAYGLSGSEYASDFYQAETKTSKTGLGVWGQIDPTYDYSGTFTPVTLQELRANENQYIGTNVQIVGVISRVYATDTFCAYIEDDNGNGAYIFAGYSGISNIKEGNEVTLKAFVSEYYGELELSNVTSASVTVVSTGNTVTPKVITVDQINDESLESSLVKINDLTVQSIYTSANGDYSVFAIDSNGHEVEIRVAKKLYPAAPSSNFPVGKQFSVVGCVSEYTDSTDTTAIPSYQLILTKLSDISFNN